MAEVSYEDLAALEQDFDDVELEILRKKEQLNAPLYKKRSALVSKIPHFWALVFEQAPPELDQWIQPSDSKLFAECLKDVSVERIEMDSPKGSPRSFTITFEFEPSEYFEETKLEKTFWYRRAKDGWVGYVSDPVSISWKKGQDLTKGLTEAAFKLWEARKKIPGAELKEVQKLPEYTSLLKKIDSAEADASLSFFSWFSFISDHPYVSAEESAAENAAERDRRERRKNGEKVAEPEEEDDDEEIELDETLQIHPAGEDLATLLAEDLWPAAIKYFTSASELDDEELSDLDEDMEEDDDDSDQEVDIRALVGKGRNGKGDSSSPPAKKRKT